MDIENIRQQNSDTENNFVQDNINFNFVHSLLIYELDLRFIVGVFCDIESVSLIFFAGSSKVFGSTCLQM